jgi:hypothetical protein
MSAAVAFASPSEHSSLAGTPRIPCRSREYGLLLSWHYLLSPRYCSTVRPSTPSGSEELPLGRRYHPTTSCSTLVVSHHLGGLLRATAAGLLHPAASHGVRRVSWCRRPSHPRVLRPVDPFPATRFIPFKGFPSSAAVPHHCGPFLHAVDRQPPRPKPWSDRGRNRLAPPHRSALALAPPHRPRPGDGLSPPKRRQLDSD